MRDHLRVVDRYEDRPDQSGAAQHGEQRSDACYDRSHEQSERQHWDKPGPERHGSFLVISMRYRNVSQPNSRYGMIANLARR
jgi:hypothetical protein